MYSENAIRATKHSIFFFEEKKRVEESMPKIQLLEI